MPGPDVTAADLTVHNAHLPQLPLTPDQIKTIPTTPGPPRLRRLAELIAGETAPGDTRDALIHGLLAAELPAATAALWREPRRPAQAALLAELGVIIAPYGTDGLAALDRLRCHLLAHRHLDELLTLVRCELDGRTEPEVLVEDGRAYAQYPYFRDSTLRVPDACYDVTDELAVHHRLTSLRLDGIGLALAGEARVHRIPDGGGTAELVLRGHATGTELRFPAQGEGDGRFTGHVPLADVPEGVWDVHLAVTARGIGKETRLGAPDATVSVVASDGTVATLAAPADGLTLDVGELRHPVQDRLRVDGAAWDPQAGPATLAVTGRCALADRPAGSLALRAASADGQVVDVPVETGPDGSFRTPFPCTAAGEWRLGLRLAAGGREWAVPVPEQPGLEVARWQRLGLPWYAKPLPDRGALSVRTGRVEVIKGVRGRLRRHTP
ncbi:hypothetical protein I5Q34_03300 [Streptomyces sp. AV19]|uniref:hypothetical protein n=1 Tax=Streptomyces sp. AV19 TaxID=2793068 RepID=UPI0018FE6B67|nr:hypothetical protein [Streptomyces sp. AV19]MBH1933323.1 hypothetical protein [Streptomyces sp. AV19]MDG4531933.1 hypothetical protein [Streptomyces sp. AV19]